MIRKSRSRSGSRSASTDNRRAGKIRIIAGRLRGRYIDVPDGADLRPTPNRVRETLFNWLQNEISGARCLDLFAGTGALGIEALSRGAASVTFIESSARVAAGLAEQLERLELAADVICMSAQEYLACASEHLDIVFADPPFDIDAAPVCAAAANVLLPGGALYCERDAADDLPALETAQWERSRCAGGVRFGLARVPS